MELSLFTLALEAFAIWGFGVSVGRYFPAVQQTPESLAAKITSICSNYQPVQDSPLCQTIFAATFSDEEWLESPYGRVPQERLDAEFLNFVSFKVPIPQQYVRDTQQNSHCISSEHFYFDLKDTCSGNETYFNNGARDIVQARYMASRRSVEPSKQSRLSSVVTALITISSLFWQWLFFTFAALVVANVLDTHWLFWIWLTVPWIWFIRLAPRNYVVIWYALASFAMADIKQKYKYPISRSWLILAYTALFLVIVAWKLIKTNREIQVSLFCFLAFTVPLEPVFDLYWPQITDKLTEILSETKQN